MKTLINCLFAFLLLIVVDLQSQTCCHDTSKFHLGSIVILPSAPTAGDSIKFVLPVIHECQLTKLGDIHSYGVDTLQRVMLGCYIISDVPSPGIFYDTINIGKLSPGNYTYISAIVPSCDAICGYDDTAYVKKATGSFIVSPLQVKDRYNLSGIKVYPNPAKDYLVVKGSYRGAVIRIYDLLGTLIATEYLADSDTKVDITKIHPGIYLYKIVNSIESISGKISILN